VTPHKVLLRAMPGRATTVAGGVNPQDVADTVWAMAMMGVTPDMVLLLPAQGRARRSRTLSNRGRP